MSDNPNPNYWRGKHTVIRFDRVSMISRKVVDGNDCTAIQLDGHHVYLPTDETLHKMILDAFEKWCTGL